jgi:hypothetical protein
MSSSKAASAQRPILGDSGPLQWSKNAKNECPIATVILPLFGVCHSFYQKLIKWNNISKHEKQAEGGNTLMNLTHTARC